MNSVAERFIGSLRREALDYFRLFSGQQILRILEQYINYYNNLRPHQGIKQNIPIGYKPQISREVRKLPILGGLCYHYERWAACHMEFFTPTGFTTSLSAPCSVVIIAPEHFVRCS